MMRTMDLIFSMPMANAQTKEAKTIIPKFTNHREVSSLEK